MRVLLVGSSADRERLRSRLNRSIEIVGEFGTVAAAREADVEADAIMLAFDPPADDLAQGKAADADDVIDEPLTPREVEVLELLAEGLPNKAIAERLRISDQTVKFHVAAICGKLGAANRTDAVRRAIRQGLVAV